MISPRFFGDDVLESCLAGHRMFAGSGDPPESVAVVQQALADLGFTVSVDGEFGSETGAAVTAYKTGKGLVPTDPVVGPGTMAALDADFAHELFDGKAAELAGARFDLGARTGERADIVDGFAICPFENGVSVEIGHVVAYAIPAAVVLAWAAAGGLDGTFGVPTGDPYELDADRSAQPFTFVVHVFGGNEDFTLPLPMWEASVAGGSLVGLPLGPPQAIGDGGATVVPHESGVVLAVPGEMPQALPQAVFNLWAMQEATGASLGPPTAFAFPTDAGQVFSFRFASITLDDIGAASLTTSVTETLQRYFQPEDIYLFRTRPMVGTVATALIGGEAVFKAMRTDIAKTSGADDFVYILSWHCNIDLELVPGDAGSTLRSLLASRAADGVQICAMLWAGTTLPNLPVTTVVPGPSGAPLPVGVPWKLTRDYLQNKTAPVNKPAVNFINGLAASGLDAAAVLDDRHLPMGSHHQKVVVMRAGGKLIAYVGGIEANVDRLRSVSGEPGSPLFDASVRLEDAGAWLVLNTFVERWYSHPTSLGGLRVPSLLAPPHSGPLTIQVTHTYGRGFPFTTAVQTAATALANGIRNARQFFYMEDQYFVGSPMMKAAIRSALASNPELVGIIVIAAEDSVGDLPDLPFRRRAFLAPLSRDFPGRLLVFERLGNGSPVGPTAYVHTKLLIVDDEAAFIGSVNSNRRSWFHDSEIDATIVDRNGAGGTTAGTRGWVRDFRCEMWSRHFNIDPALLGDFATSLAIWRAVVSGQSFFIGDQLIHTRPTPLIFLPVFPPFRPPVVVSVRPYDVAATVPRCSIAGIEVPGRVLDRAWDSIEDPA